MLIEQQYDTAVAVAKMLVPMQYRMSKTYIHIICVGFAFIYRYRFGFDYRSISATILLVYQYSSIVYTWYQILGISYV